MEVVTETNFAQVYAAPLFTVFKWEGNYETIMTRITEHVPQGKLFEVSPINPGTSLFTVYGCNHFVVTENKEIL